MDASHPYYFIADPLQQACAESAGEVKAGLLVSCVVDPELDPVRVEQQLEDFVADLKPVSSGAALLEQFRDLGFGHGAAFRASAQHSNLIQVWQRREGLPISLALLLMAVARRAGLKLRGVNFPGHFLVELDGTLVDPLLMAPMQERDNTNAAGLYANAESIGLRMLNNLKSLAMMRTDLNEMLNLLDLQLHICSSGQAQATLYYEQAEVWLKFGSVAPALQALANCIAHASHEELVAQAEKKLAQLRGRNETRH